MGALDEKKIDAAVTSKSSQSWDNPASDLSGSYRFFPDDPDSPISKAQFAVKSASQYFDPCTESAKMSLNCLDRNNYDRSQCKEYFDAYRECKRLWLEARRANRHQWE